MIPQDTTRLDARFFKTLEVDGHRLRVYDEGDADQPAILMLHGAPHSSEEFRYNVPALRKAGYRVVVPDHLGAGESDRPEDLTLYTGYADYQRSLAVMDALGIDTFYAEGGDRGSLPLWMLAAFHPDRVLAVISENVSHLNGFFSSGLDQKRRSWYMYFLQFDAAKEALRANEWELLKAFFDYHPDVNDMIRDFERPNGLEGAFLNWYRANIHPDRAPKLEPLPNTSQPVLQLYSNNDPYIGPEQLATGPQYIDGPITMKRIDGAGHFIARNAPDEFNAAVIDFLAAQEARRNAS
ncbi:MAG: alpha/beta hydrolase [Myxococcota bacterium]